MSKRIKGIAGLVLWVLWGFYPVAASGGVFYVATTGNDDPNGGSLAAPWRTVQYAVDQASPGDTVYVRGGVYNELVSIVNKGSAASYITLQNYPGETPIIDGTGVGHDHYEIGLFYIAHSSYLTIRGFELRNLITNSAIDDPAGIWVQTASYHPAHETSHITLQDNLIYNIRNTAATLTTYAGAHGIIVRGTVAGTPIHDVTVDRNEIRNCVLGWSESLTFNGNVQDFVVSNNRIHDNNNIGIVLAGGYGECSGCTSDEDQARDGTCIGNTVYNIDTSTNPAYACDGGCAGGIYVDGGARIIVEKNTVHHCNIGLEVASENPGKESSEITVRNNFVYANDIGGIAIGGYEAALGSTQDCHIVNNTFSNNDTKHKGHGELWVQYNTQNNAIRNNIFAANSQNRFISNENTTNTGNTLDYNLYYSPGGANNSKWQWKTVEYTSFSSWQSGTGNDTHSLFINPQLVDPDAGDLHLSSNSPAKNQGANLGSTICGNEDIDGEPRVSDAIIDIGADEINPGGFLLWTR